MADGKEDGNNVVASYMFRGIEYVLSMSVSQNVLTMEVEDRITADQWRGSFDAAYVEDLTHKTGNFKQFSIFISMLESAITQSSDSVSLDLLTYSDLESLRNRKAGLSRSAIPAANSTASLGSKRYLILTYTVEFDRIHYPLPLPYMGKPDPRALQESVRQLRQEIKHLKSQNNRDFKMKEIEKLHQRYNLVQKEKEIIETELLDYKRQMSLTSTGAAAKEIKILKQMVKALEEDLLKEKTKHQKASHKRNAEIRKFLNEIDDLKSSERNLKARVKSLTNEIALYRRDGRKSLSQSSRNRSFTRDRSSSRENSFASRKDTSRLSARDRSTNVKRDRSNSKDRSWNSQSGRERFSRARSSSQERYGSRDNSASRIRSNSREHPRPSSAGSYRRDSPYSSGLRKPRFDPTAYIEERERKKQNKKSASARRLDRRTPSPSFSYNGRKHSRTSSIGSVRSRTSSIDSLDSLSEIGPDSDSAFESRYRPKFRKSKPFTSKNSSNMPSSPEISYPKSRSSNHSKNLISSTPESDRKSSKTWQKENIPHSQGMNSYINRNPEINEIDARLSKLQELMKSSLP